MTRAEHQRRKGRSSCWLRPEKRQRIYARDRHRCVWCQRTRAEAELSVDHFLPRELGGKNGTGNLITACLRCNSRRQHKPALVFAFELGTLFGDGYAALDRALDALAAPLPAYVP